MRENLLVVDDDPMIHRMLDFAFRDSGFSIVSKLNGEDASKWVEENHPALSAMVLDWEMPGISGLDLLKKLKKDDRFRDIPVVMLTSHSEKSEIQQGIDAGAYYYITKPFNKEFLKSIIGRAVYDYRQQQELKRQLKESQNPFRNMTKGSFKLQTFEEAQKLSLLIANASENPDQSILICELLVNAVEHGNLGIGYEEKTKLLEENRLMEEIAQRLNLPEYRSKYATVDVSKESGILKVLVKDEGKGFNYSKFLDFDPARIFDNHGRGIAMAKSMLELQYHGNGNQVEVIIPMNCN